MANNDRKKAVAQNWKYSHRYIRIEHNKSVNKWFKETLTQARTNLRNSLLIYKTDSTGQMAIKMSAFAHYINKNTDELLTFPLQFNTRKLPNVSQLSIIFRPTAKSNTSGNYTLNIPHYNGARSPNITAHRKGNHWAKFTCKDKASILVYCSSKTEATRVASELNRYVDRKYKSDELKPSTGFMEHKPHKTIQVEPIRADFFKEGKINNTVPEWRYYFN